MSHTPVIAIVGTGIMGAGIAKNFLKNGYAVRVWNRSPGRAQDLVKTGAILAASPCEAAADADIVFEVTANDESSRAVWQGDDGIMAGAKPDSTFITSATLSVGWTDELARLSAQQDHPFFDMPLTGGRKGAETGNLVLLAGGEKTAVKKLEPTLKAIARNVRYFGPVGSGMRYKLILNSLQAVIVAGFGEATRMAREAGLDDRAVAQALAEAPGGYTLELLGNQYPTAPQPLNFSVDWITKDLEYAKQMVSKTDHPLMEYALRAYQAKVKAGKGTADWSVIAYPQKKSA